jgi:membrane-bound lytic murein transglycosylase D
MADARLLKRLLPGLLLVLTGCQSMVARRIDAPAPRTDIETPATADARTVEIESHALTVPEKPVLVEPIAAPEPIPHTGPEPDVWQRLRANFAMPGCDYAPGALDWARRYAASPDRFANVLEQMLPALDYTQKRVEAADLPAEFALLPIVESHYHPFEAPQSRPAGIWQMIGPTAKSAGVRIDPWFDGRLNLAESTDGAIQLLDRYAEHFNEDWRLVAFAYNAGEYRVRRALERHQPGDDFDSLRGLNIAKTSYEYLTKLLALSCIIREPERFDLSLPTLSSKRELTAVEMDGVIGSSLARALSGLSDEDYARVNAGMRRGRTPPGEAQTLLVSAGSADRIHDIIDDIPAGKRIEWQQQRFTGTESLETIAERNGLLLDTLLAINEIDTSTQIEPGERIWLPGRVSTPQQAVQPSGDGIHIVRSGESLWAIARRYGLTVAELLRYNQLGNERLLPGQRLRLTSP